MVEHALQLSRGDWQGLYLRLHRGDPDHTPSRHEYTPEAVYPLLQKVEHVLLLGVPAHTPVAPLVTAAGTVAHELAGGEQRRGS